MSLPAPIKISDQSNQIQVVLGTWATPRGGVASVVSNLREMWNQASQSSQKPRILICYNGESSRGDFSVANRNHRVDREWQIAVTRGRGFSANRGDSLSETVGNAEPFYDSVETIRDMFRTMIGISEEIPIDYRDIKPMQLGDLVIDGYVIKATTANDIPGIQRIPPIPPS